jgi:hypothetical protein
LLLYEGSIFAVQIVEKRAAASRAGSAATGSNPAE